MERACSTPNVTLLSKIRMVLLPTMPEPVTSLNSTRLPFGATMTSMRERAVSALMLRNRGRNFGGIFGGGVQPALDLDLHELGAQRRAPRCGPPATARN